MKMRSVNTNDGSRDVYFRVGDLELNAFRIAGSKQWSYAWIDYPDGSHREVSYIDKVGGSIVKTAVEQFRYAFIEQQAREWAGAQL